MKHRSAIAALIAAVGLFGWMVLADEALQGDLDQSGAIDAADLVLLANYQAGNLNDIPAQFGQLWGADPIVGALRRVPAGTFTQGAPGTEPCDGGDESQFSHTLDRDVAVMATEVTRRMWAQLLEVQPTLPVDPTNTAFGSGLDNPVQMVTWYEAVLFANLLSLQRGRTRCYYTDSGFTTPIDATNYNTSGSYFCDFDADGFRLPSEGEWERFCRAGTSTAFWIVESNYTSGNCGGTSTSGMYPSLETAAWFKANSSTTTQPVGGRAANPWGLYDVHGNVTEWCWDWYGTYPGTSTDYTGPGSGSNRVSRGGSRYHNALYCRSASRGNDAPGTRLNHNGFRLVMSLP